MADLRTALEEAGYHGVRTYIQSGNVHIESADNPSDLKVKIQDVLRNNFQLEVPVMIRKQADLVQILANNPYALETLEEPRFMSFGFLSNVPDQEKIDEVMSYASEIEKFAIDNDILYFYCGTGFGKTKLTNAFFERKLVVDCTMRNYNTTKKLSQF